MIDVQSEALVRLHDARKLRWLKGRNGGRLDIGTLRRWALRGFRGVMLETVKIGGTTYTSEEATLRFIGRLNGGLTAVSELPERRQDVAAMNKRLDDAGIV